MNKSNKREADIIVKSITDQVCSKKIALGSRLPSEAKLCEQYKVSRTVIREALQQLKAQGLLETKTGSGSYITGTNLKSVEHSFQLFSMLSNTPEQWLELTELRSLLESECAFNLADKYYSTYAVEKLKEAHSEMESKLNDIEAFAKADVQFHETMVELTSNKVLKTVLSALRPLQMRFSLETYKVGDFQTHVSLNLAEHKAILDAIIAKEPQKASNAMRKHLAGAKHNILRYIELS